MNYSDSICKIYEIADKYGLNNLNQHNTTNDKTSEKMIELEIEKEKTKQLEIIEKTKQMELELQIKQLELQMQNMAIGESNGDTFDKTANLLAQQTCHRCKKIFALEYSLKRHYKICDAPKQYNNPEDFDDNNNNK